MLIFIFRQAVVRRTASETSGWRRSRITQSASEPTSMKCGTWSSNTFGKTTSRVSNCSQTHLPIDNALQTNSTSEFFRLDRKQGGRQRSTTLNVAIFVHSLERHELISASARRKANFLLKLAFRGCGAALCRNLRNARPTSSNVCNPVPQKKTTAMCVEGVGISSPYWSSESETEFQMDVRVSATTATSQHDDYEGEEHIQNGF